VDRTRAQPGTERRRRESRAALAVCAGLALFLGATRAGAQVSGSEPPFAGTIELFANLTGAAVAAPRGPAPEHALWGRADIALRTFLRIETDAGWAFGPRVVVQRLGHGPVELGDRSLVLATPWGRLEYGYRQGLPDTLVGYAPNSYTFTGVEFGPPSGLNLFPHGGLQTSFLASPAGVAVSSLSYLGIATAFAGDFSRKLIYVSPRFLGLQLGLAGTTDADSTPFGADYGRSGQAGLVHESYFGQNVFRVGGSYGFGYRRLPDGDAGLPRKLHSGNLGATLVVNDEWIIGASASLDYARRTLVLDDRSSGIGFGATISVNRESGPWAVGGFLPEARRRDGRTSPVHLFAGEAGASYRFDTRLRIYAAVYLFDLADGNTLPLVEAARGGVLLAGVRGQL